MLNLLCEYVGRSLPETGDFTTNPGLEKKVSPDGALLPFRGNTAVFLLDSRTRRALSALRDKLYAAAPDMLAHPLSADTFHMTLHDLANGVPGEPTLDAEMARTAALARPLLDRWRKGSPMVMEGTWVFNMVSTSLVLGLKPLDSDCEDRLDTMYQALEEVRPLGYALTPHITLAYFRPGHYAPEQVSLLRAALGPAPLRVTLQTENLVLQEFAHMGSYTTV